MASSSLRPSGGLLHPAWLGSLAVLALNDHVLKGADLLPPLLTGKLSDVAGLVVAPLLLAAILRVRSRRAWVACHLAVGVVFSAIQLSATCAAGWSALMGAVGFPWVITRDVTDLIALPALALSLWGLTPALRRPAAQNARRSAEAGAAAVGLLCCVATSYEEDCCEVDTSWGTDTDTDGDTDGDVPLPELQADVYLSNATAQDRVVRIRPLRLEVQLDCEIVAEDPGGLLRSSLFAPAQSWTLPANTNVEVLDHQPGAAPCYAAWVEGDALPAHVLLWMDGEPPITAIPGDGQRGGMGEVTILDAGAEGLRLEAGYDLAFVVAPVEPPSEGECAPQPDASRVGWSHPVPWGPASLESIEVGLDGCLALELSRDGLAPQAWYLCVPASSFPFVAGDDVELRLPEGADPSVEAIELVARDEQGEPLAIPSLLASAGTSLPVMRDLELQAVPLYGCDVASEPQCGTVERPLKVLASGPDLEAMELHAGDPPVHQSSNGRVVELTLMHAQERFVLDPVCGQGPDGVGLDLEVVIAQRPRGI